MAILAADVEGYSRMMGRDEEGTLETLSSFRTIIDTVIARRHGRICGTAGDSVLAEFASVFAAVQSAVEIQRRLSRANEGLAGDQRMWFRIGVNVGDVMVKASDIFGDGVNIAARIESLAEPGGICISRGVHDHVMRRLDYQFEDLGEKSVKNIAQPIRVFRLIFDAQGAVALEDFDAEPINSSSVAEVAISASPSEAHAENNAVDPKSIELMFWDTIKESVRAADYKAYLENYPDGSFVTLAQSRIVEFSAEVPPPRDPQDREVELLFWESVRGSDNPSFLHAYLEKYPDGEFKMLAEIRISELEAAVG